MILRNRQLWPYIVRPMLWTAGIFFALVIGGYFLIVPWLARVTENWGVGAVTGWLGGSALFVLALFFLGGIVFLAIAGILSSLLWDKLSIEVEELEFGQAASHKQSNSEWIFDTVCRTIFSIFIAVLSLVIGWTCLGATAVVLAAWLGLLDYSASAFLRRRVIYPVQNFSVWQCPGWISFSLVAGLISLLPLVNVILFPALVAGGTLMTARRFPP